MVNLISKNVKLENIQLCFAKFPLYQILIKG